jgi:hypothetical protein
VYIKIQSSEVCEFYDLRLLRVGNLLDWKGTNMSTYLNALYRIPERSLRLYTFVSVFTNSD